MGCEPGGLGSSLLRRQVPGAARFLGFRAVFNFKQPCGARHLLIAVVKPGQSG